MGGGYYGGADEREVPVTTASQIHSSHADEVFRASAQALQISTFISSDEQHTVRQKKTHPSLDPLNKKLICAQKNPLIVALGTT